MHFTKYHGTGNDFIMLDSRKNGISDRSVERISALCDRHFGIGADGLIILDESKKHDFRMTYFNSDGHPGTMCGNGGRCATAFARQQGWIINDCHFEASDGLHFGSVCSDGSIKLSMNDVSKVEKIHPEEAGAVFTGVFKREKSQFREREGMDNPSEGSIELYDHQAYIMDTGSPHLVIFVKALDKLDVYSLGKKLRYDPRFVNGINVNFVERTSQGIKVRTYERGVENETLSCGTGVTASAIAASLYNETVHAPVKVETRGGKLEVSFVDHRENGVFGNITLSGPVTKVFEGELKF